MHDIIQLQGIIVNKKEEKKNGYEKWLWNHLAIRLRRICMKFCTVGPLGDIINHAEFCLNQVRGFDSVGGQIFDFFTHRAWTIVQPVMTQEQNHTWHN